jgi:UDP-GlcNAc:undecaprenyl-phosphate GlcNAc-1-phosphate transferase
VAGGLLVCLLTYRDGAAISPSLLWAGIVIVGLGLWDDIKGVPPLWKLALQTIAALLALGGGVCLTRLGVLSAPATLLWLILLPNAFNLIDGLDGLCAGCGGIVSFSLALLAAVMGCGEIALLAIILLGGCLGFLPHNLRYHKVFLGDTGAQFIGFTAGLLSVPLINNGGGASVLLILLYPLIETATTILRRLKNKKSPFRADRGHFHHRLTDRHISSGRAVGLLLLPTFLVGNLGVVLSISPWMGIPLAAISLAAIAVLWRCEVAPQGTEG